MLVYSDINTTSDDAWVEKFTNTCWDYRLESSTAYTDNITTTGWVTSGTINDNRIYRIDPDISWYNDTATESPLATYTKCDFNWRIPLIDPQNRLRDIIKKRQSPAIIRSRQSENHISDPREMRARETLRRVLGSNKYQRFLRDGFISVRAKSGLIYQIFPSYKMTNVFDRGKCIETLCVVLNGDFPPTDSLIMRYLLILNDEREFRKLAIKHSVPRRQQHHREQIIKPLSAIWNDIKAAA